MGRGGGRSEMSGILTQSSSTYVNGFLCQSIVTFTPEHGTRGARF